MAYVTNADIQERLGNATYVQLADDDGNGQADVGVVDEARLGAEGEVNSYLARRFQVPIDLAVHTDLADLLASITLDLAEYRLRARRPPISEDARRRRTEAVTWLSRVASDATRGSLGATTGEERFLSRDELADH